MRRVDDYRSGYSCGYSDGKTGQRMRDKDAAQAFFGEDASGVPDVSEHQLSQETRTDEYLLELIDILARRVQDGGQGMADNQDSPLMRLREKIANERRPRAGD